MAITIAISGKGGTGKTTLAAMMIRLLCEQKARILAVDADPNSCLGLMLGAEPVITVAQLREQARDSKPSNTGIDKVRTFEYGIAQAITEAAGFDLLTMGRPEGPGCYCAINNLLRTFMDKLSSSYDYVLIDNEAGMEHLSRRTTNNVDLLFIVAQPTALGQATVERIFHLVGNLPIAVKRTGIIWNSLGAENSKTPRLTGVENLGYVPYDKGLYDVSMRGQSIFDIDGDSPAFMAIRSLFERESGKLKTSVAH